jgi:hypothetical protein
LVAPRAGEARKVGRWRAGERGNAVRGQTGRPGPVVEVYKRACRRGGTGRSSDRVPASRLPPTTRPAPALLHPEISPLVSDLSLPPHPPPPAPPLSSPRKQKKTIPRLCLLRRVRGFSVRVDGSGFCLSDGCFFEETLTGVAGPRFARLLVRRSRFFFLNR